jgi:hypothetical protein
VGQEWLGPSYFFISLVLGPLNSLLEESTDPNRYTAKAKFCFCKNNKRMIIITTLAKVGPSKVIGGEVWGRPAARGGDVATSCGGGATQRLTQGAPVSSGSSRLGIETKTPG